jgi:hypothetical protein
MSSNTELPDFIPLNLTIEKKQEFINRCIEKHRCSAEPNHYCHNNDCNQIHIYSYSQRFNCKRLIYLSTCTYGDNCHRYERDSCNHFHSKQILDWYEIYVKTNNEKLMCDSVINYLNSCFIIWLLIKDERMKHIIVV